MKLITDKVLLIEFLMQRANAKQILIQVLQSFMTQLPVSLMEMPAIFDKLNSVYRNYLESEIQNQVMSDKIPPFTCSGQQSVKCVSHVSIADGDAAAE